jgi:hypothetical protein
VRLALYSTSLRATRSPANSRKKPRSRFPFRRVHRLRDRSRRFIQRLLP